jgi:ribosomal protein S18 acetylase RimI-like enzyme
MKRNSIKIRNAKKKEINAIFDLWLESMIYHARLEPVIFGFNDKKADAGKKFISEQMKKKSAIFIVAEKNRQIVGYLLGRIIKRRLPFQKLRRTGWILDIVVQEKERNKGIGSLLLKKALKLFKRKNIKVLMLSVSERNKTAINFYKKHKFTTYLRSMVRNL